MKNRRKYKKNRRWERIIEQNKKLPSDDDDDKIIGECAWCGVYGEMVMSVGKFKYCTPLHRCIHIYREPNE